MATSTVSNSYLNDTLRKYAQKLGIDNLEIAPDITTAGGYYVHIRVGQRLAGLHVQNPKGITKLLQDYVAKTILDLRQNAIENLADYRILLDRAKAEGRDIQVVRITPNQYQVLLDLVPIPSYGGVTTLYGVELKVQQ